MQAQASHRAASGSRAFLSGPVSGEDTAQYRLESPSSDSGG